MDSNENALWADENRPQVSKSATVYFVEFPSTDSEGRTARAWITVDENDYCESIHWHWFGKIKHGSDTYRTEQFVWKWLTEWELVELRPIGPEDSEYFATHNLTGRDADGD